MNSDEARKTIDTMSHLPIPAITLTLRQLREIAQPGWAARDAARDARDAVADERQWQEQRLIHLTQSGVWTAP